MTVNEFVEHWIALKANTSSTGCVGCVVRAMKSAFNALHTFDALRVSARPEPTLTAIDWLWLTLALALTQTINGLMDTRLHSPLKTLSSVTAVTSVTSVPKTLIIFLLLLMAQHIDSKPVSNRSPALTSSPSSEELALVRHLCITRFNRFCLPFIRK